VTYYGTTTVATDFTVAELRHWKIKLARALLFFVPRANPDIEMLYPQVRKWALELSEDGWPQREIGLGDQGAILFRTPNDRNTGFWTDMALRKFERSELQEISASEFEHLWGSHVSSSTDA
jgi:hypothetical protein